MPSAALLDRLAACRTDTLRDLVKADDVSRIHANICDSRQGKPCDCPVPALLNRARVLLGADQPFPACPHGFTAWCATCAAVARGDVL